MIDPVIISDGYTYERDYIEKWLKSSCKSPVTGQYLNTKNIIPNNIIKDLSNKIPKLI